MAKIYVDSNAVGANDGSSWANAYTTLQAGLTNWTTSDIIWIAHDSAESSGSSVTLTCPVDTELLPVPIYRVNSGTDLYDPPPFDLTDTAQITTTSSAAQIRFTFHTKMYGIRFDGGGNFNNSGDYQIYLEDCDIEIGGGSTGGITVYPGGSIYKNCYIRRTTTGVVQFATGTNGRVLKFISCTLNFLGVISSGLIAGGGTFPANINFIDCNLSALPSATVLVDTSTLSSGGSFNDQNVTFNNCKLPSSYVIGDGTMDAPRANVLLIGCSTNGATTYINRHLTYAGELDTSITVYRGAGYIEKDGDINLSMELTPASNCEPFADIFTSNIAGIVDATGSKTFTIECIENFTTALTEQEFWLKL